MSNFKKYTPSYSLQKLIDGNNKYLNSSYNDSIIDASTIERLSDIIQTPYACIICCSDSRVVPEHIFNTGIGELFVIATVGNLVDQLAITTAEYAALNLNVPLIVVMGHTHCAVVNSAINNKKIEHLSDILDEVKEVIGEETHHAKCSILNAKNSKMKLNTSNILQNLQTEGKLQIITALYDMPTGKVEFHI
ncbi:MAG: carbonic anhydrase [Eubacteriales bacterium]|nr:carbonic anhydrase [Eubacteriales bacterium]MDY3332903.1 carbonic anhydrase [Gallibacter sp.]